jgi:hypothetical protein
MMNDIFLIFKGWIDPMENRDADGYDPIGFVTNEDAAKRICDEGGFYTAEQCWSIQFHPDKKMPKFKYIKLPYLIDERLKIENIKILLKNPDYEFRFQMAGAYSSDSNFKCNICGNMVNSIVQTAYHKHNPVADIHICGDCYQLFSKIE